jgi:hypothetical protein
MASQGKAGIIAERSSHMARSIQHKAMRGAQKLARVAARGDHSEPIDRIVMWPPVRTGTELADLSARLRWYVPEHVAVDLPVEGIGLIPQPVPWFDVEDQTTPLNVDVLSARAIDLDRGTIAVWRDAKRTLRSAPIARRLAAVTIVDPDYLGLTDVASYTELAQRTARVPELDDARRRSAANFERLLASVDGTRRALVYGTGPSMRDVTPGEVGADVVIACNSAVRDPEWIQATRPKVIAFADPVFHYGPSRYAATFRTDLEKAVEISDAFVVTTSRYLPLLVRHLPGLLDRAIVLDMVPGSNLRVPSPASPSVTQTENVLTLLMLPLAGAMDVDVALAGCDGRAPGETYFWRHSTQGQYSDELMGTVARAHPAFFRDRNYGDYYATHCKVLDMQITGLERAGHTVTSVTPSMIPALQARMPGGTGR